MPGEISGFSESNITNTQLDTGHMEMTTVVDAVKDSGAIDVTLNEDEQGDSDATDVQDDNGNKAQPETREMNVSNNVGVVKWSVAADAILKDGEAVEVNAMVVRPATNHAPADKSTKCNQETQTELSTNLCTDADAAE